MNILPKKRWHVRTKENIARVRKDEAEAAEKERQEQQRIENADREARLNLLREKSRQKLKEADIVEPTPTTSEVNEHINLFSDLEHAVTTTNKEHDEAVKQKKEEYEKQIGYLTYLGQDTNEALRKKNWYEVLPDSRLKQADKIKNTYDKLVLKDVDGKPKTREPDIKDGEVDYKAKKRHDPMNKFSKYISKYKSVTKDSDKKLRKKCKKEKKSKKDKLEDKKAKLEKLRAERLKREKQEKSRTEAYLACLHGETTEKKKPEPPKLKPKYNSQFNPELARQNYS